MAGLTVLNIGSAGALRPGLSGIHEPGVVLNHDLSADLVRALGHDPQERLDVGESEVVLATGDVFVSDPAVRDGLAQRAHLVDMEGYAVAYAAREAGSRSGSSSTCRTARTRVRWTGRPWWRCQRWPWGSGSGRTRCELESEVLAAAEARASALVEGDADRLLSLLHPAFRWTTPCGDAPTTARSTFAVTPKGHRPSGASQELVDTHIVVVGDAAVLHGHVTDVVLGEDGQPATFRMPMTQVWVRSSGAWLCLAGHAGPRLR